MLTILAIEESLMLELSNFEPLLQSVADKGEFKICSWKKSEETLENAIPALFDREFITEGELMDYNILVVSDDRNCYAENPFAGEYDAENESSAPNDKKLNELAKMLGIVPAHSNAKITMPENKKGQVKWEIEVDKSLTEEKLSQYKIEDFTRPRSIYLFAVQKKYDVDIGSFVTDKLTNPEKHAQFSSAGRYPSNCRFFKFNLSSKSNRITMDDYFRLSMTILSFAYNDGNDDMFFAPYTLYTIDSDINKDEIATEINGIYSRVHFVKRFTQNEIARIRKLREYNKDKYYDMPILDNRINVQYNTDESGLYLIKKRFGLAKNCPVEDEPEFDKQREEIEKNIKQYLKAPVRALRTAVRQTKEQGVFVSPTDEIIHLTREQTEDLDEEIENLEIEIIKSEEINIDYPKVNENARKESDKETRDVMKKRSRVGAIIGGSVISFVAYLVAFLPYIYNVYNQSKGDSKAIGEALIVTLGAIGVMAIVGFICLLILKAPLSKAFRYFGKLIDMLVRFVQNQTTAYSNYLSKLVGFMKRNSFKRYLDSDNDSFLKGEEDKFILNRNHCQDVEKLCQDWANGFNFSLNYDESRATKNFLLDDSPKANDVYTFIVSDGEYNIKYNESPSRLEMPYSFVSSLNIKREEVYE